MMFKKGDIIQFQPYSGYVYSRYWGRKGVIYFYSQKFNRYLVSVIGEEGQIPARKEDLIFVESGGGHPCTNVFK